MKNKHRLLPVLTAAALCLTPFSASADEEKPVLSLSSGCTSENNVVPLTLSIDKETKAAAYSVTLDFDPSKLEFASAADDIGTGTFYFNDISEDSVRLVWSNDRDVSVSGSIFTVCFKARGGTNGERLPVEIGYSVLGSEDMNEIPFDTENAEITVSEDFVCGDADCDGRTDISDLISLNKSLSYPQSFALSEQGLINSDINNDGNVDMTDFDAVLRLVSCGKAE